MRTKYIYPLLLFVLSVLGLSSCEDNETPVYDVSRTALNLWFGSEIYPVDSLTYNYSYAMEESSVTFYARVSGLPADHDRTFTLEMVDGSVEAEGSYRTETYTIPAGEILAEFPIYFNTTLLQDPESFTTTDGYLCFRLAPNNEFETGAEEYSELIVRLRNYLAKPDNWDSADYSYLSLSYVFGAYSREKYQFMIDVLGIMEFSINRNATVPYDEENNELSLNYANYLLQTLQLALEEYNATHDEPLRDSSGALVTF